MIDDEETLDSGVSGPEAVKPTDPEEAAALAPADPGNEEATEASAAAPAVDPESPGNEAVEPAAESAAEEAAPTFRYDEKFYAPISPDHPAGEEVEFYHFAEMDQELSWPRNEFDRPDVKQRPNFRAAKQMALDLLNGKGELKAVKDVRPMLGLMTAEAGDAGPVGLAKTLDLFVTNCMEYWDEIHPQKEDEDDDELMTRMEEMRRYFNAQVLGLCVEPCTVARSQRVGEITTRTFGIATTKVAPREGEFAPDTGTMTALLTDEPEVKAGVAEAHAAYRHSIDCLHRFRKFLDGHPDVDPVDLETLAETLETYAGYLAPHIGDAAPAAEPADGDDTAAVAEGAPGAAPAPTSGPKTRAEAMELIDEILGYYADGAMSSPVPLGLLTLRDLMSSDFNAWIRETAPKGLKKAALKIATVDGGRLAAFASDGGAAAAAAAAPKAIPVDFTEIDAALYQYSGLIESLEKSAAALAGGEGAESPLGEEIAALKASHARLEGCRNRIEEMTGPGTSGNSDEENATEGDARHRRITSRNDVKASLDQIAAFFEREEPSSPAPSYLRRLRSLVDARFSDIAKELFDEDSAEVKLALEPRTNLR